MSLLAWRAARRSAVLQTRALGARGDFKQSYGFRGGAAVAQGPKERTLDDQHVNPHEKDERVFLRSRPSPGTVLRYYTGLRRLCNLPRFRGLTNLDRRGGCVGHRLVLSNVQR